MLMTSEPELNGILPAPSHTQPFPTIRASQPRNLFGAEPPQRRGRRRGRPPGPTAAGRGAAAGPRGGGPPAPPPAAGATAPVPPPTGWPGPPPPRGPRQGADPPRGTGTATGKWVPGFEPGPSQLPGAFCFASLWTVSGSGSIPGSPLAIGHRRSFTGVRGSKQKKSSPSLTECLVSIKTFPRFRVQFQPQFAGLIPPKHPGF